VATYALGEQEPKYHVRPSQETHKVSLDVYRRESFKILSLLKRFAKRIEKASIDEAFIDLTPVILNKYPDLKIPDSKTLEGIEVLGSMDTERFIFNSDEIRDIRLLQGALIMKEIRAAIFEELGYTCSAGVARNKPLAKLCSSMHKPNRQVVLLESHVKPFLKDIPVTKIPGLGGKMGESILERFQVKTCGEIW
jgi:DNA polymerase eta